MLRNIVYYGAVFSILGSFAPRLTACVLLAVSLRMLRLHPRKTIDIGAVDLMFALWYVLVDFLRCSPKREAIEHAVCSRWSSADDAVVCLSLRTGMDAVLAALALPKGSEVLFAPGITIPAVVDLVEARGLVPRPVAASGVGELPSVGELIAQITDKSRVLIVTHAFGVIYNAAALIREAQSHGLYVIDDCAENFVGSLQRQPVSNSAGGLRTEGFRGHSRADASFVSFGLIKTHTALGGSLGIVRDSRVREQMRKIQGSYPIDRQHFHRVLMKGMALALIAPRAQICGFSPAAYVFGFVCSFIEALGVKYDGVILGSSRGGLHTAFKRRPSVPLLRMLRRRLESQRVVAFDDPGSSLRMQRTLGQRIASRLTDAGIQVLGSSAPASTWWLMTVCDETPHRMVRYLTSRGFDATCSTSQLAPVVAKSQGVECPPEVQRTIRAFEQLVYLPLDATLGVHGADRLTEAVLEYKRRSPTIPGTALPHARPWLFLFVLALALAVRPCRILSSLLSPSLLLWATFVFLGMLALTAAVLRRVASVIPPLGKDFLAAMAPRRRVEGAQFLKDALRMQGRVDGAVLVTGATGFLGGAVLFSLLAKAKSLNISRVVVLIRAKKGQTVEQRLGDLRRHPALAEVLHEFDRIVRPMQGDTCMPHSQWGDAAQAWPHAEPLQAVIHCAADVRFELPLQAAAVSLITGSLQMAQVAARWGAKRCILVSTAFVCPAPSTDPLPEQLFDFGNFSPMELYRDALSNGKWARKVMRHFGFPNTYAFAKAVAEHVFVQVCSTENLEAVIVRPSVIGPAWAAPFAGWSGDKPSTIVGGLTLWATGVTRMYRGSPHPLPLVPVDLVAGVVLGALTVRAASDGSGVILHAAVDSSQASRVHSMFEMADCYLSAAVLRGDMPLPLAGAISWLSRTAESERFFRYAHRLVNVAPWALLHAVSLAGKRLGCTMGVDLARWCGNPQSLAMCLRCSNLPALYSAFTCPPSPWRFDSQMRLPEGWSASEYTMLIVREAEVHAQKLRQVHEGASPEQPAFELNCATVSAGGSWLMDLVLTCSIPGAQIHQCIAAFLVNRVFVWMDLRVTLDVASLQSVANAPAPLVLCPTHRSCLDFVILGLLAVRLRPLLPAMQMPHVAADAEFAGLWLMGSLLERLGAFFIRRGGGAVQPDPGAQAAAARAVRGNKPIQVFLEGSRVRGRRFLRLRTGLLRVLRKASKQDIAVVPVALSYEHLPEDGTFYDELSGQRRAALRNGALLSWAWQGFQGSLRPHGDAHIRFGPARKLEASSDLASMLSSVQDDLVTQTSVTALHARVLGELLELPGGEAQQALSSAGVVVRPSRLPGADGPPLRDADRWPLVLQACTLLRHHLPAQWSQWLVESTVDRPTAELPDGAAESASLQKLISRLCEMLHSAEAAADAAAAAVGKASAGVVTEALLFKYISMPPQGGGSTVPPPLARGAAYIVALKLRRSSTAAGIEACCYEGADAAAAKVAPSKRALPNEYVLWSAPEQLSNEEALGRWGFEDTRFKAQCVDGKPAICITSKRYGNTALPEPSPAMWSFMEEIFDLRFDMRDILSDAPLPDLPPPAHGLLQALESAIPQARIDCGVRARLRSGSGHGLAEIWRLRTGAVQRMPDAVVRPEHEAEIGAVLGAAVGPIAFAVVPVGGGTNVTSATACPAIEVDARPFVALDMRGLSRVLWVNAEDGIALVEAGITGSKLKEELAKHSVTMGMEPDSMEFSTLGGWVATRASGMKRARYGNIEDMIVDVRVVTPAGVLWQNGGDYQSDNPRNTAFGRTSTNLTLPGLLLGSEGCLGVVVSAVVRVRPLPEVTAFESVIFPDYGRGAAWWREVGKLPPALRPTSCRLMDATQLRLARAVKGEDQQGFLSSVKSAYLQAQGISLNSASAATLLFEGSRKEVAMQKGALVPLVRSAGGVWGGGRSGEAGYALTFAIAYLRDVLLDYRLLSESLETMVPWTAIDDVWPAVVQAVQTEHKALRLPGKPLLSCRMTQQYSEGGVLYMYVGTCIHGQDHARGLECYERLEQVARDAVLQAGGSVSHHHGVGKHRASLMASAQAPALTSGLRALKAAWDPHGVLGARNGVWAHDAVPAALAADAAAATSWVNCD